jgi:hypothetical protein
MVGVAGISGGDGVAATVGATAGVVTAAAAAIVDIVAVGLASANGCACGLTCTNTKELCDEPDGLSSAGESGDDRSGVSGNGSSLLSSSILVRLCVPWTRVSH